MSFWLYEKEPVPSGLIYQMGTWEPTFVSTFSWSEPQQSSAFAMCLWKFFQSTSYLMRAYVLLLSCFCCLFIGLNLLNHANKLTISKTHRTLCILAKRDRLAVSSLTYTLLLNCVDNYLDALLMIWTAITFLTPQLLWPTWRSQMTLLTAFRCSVQRTFALSRFSNSASFLFPPWM